MAFTITSRLHQVAERTTRTRDDHKEGVGCDGTLAMDPKDFALALALSNAVMAAAPQTLGLGYPVIGL